MNMPQSDDELKAIGYNGETINHIARGEMKDSIGERVDHVYVKPSQNDFQIQLEETILHTLQLSNRSAANKINTRTTRDLDKVINEVFS